MGFLIEHWKELLIFFFFGGGAISLPAIGFLSDSPSINWSKPSGYYTQATLTIENMPSNDTASTSSKENINQKILKNYQLVQVGTSVSLQTNKNADLIAEFPLKYLDKPNWWKYCLPESSKLKSSGSQSTAVNKSNTEANCVLNWWKKSNGSNSESISYLLDLILKFLKLQHQINLITLFHSSDGAQVSSSGDNLLSQVKTTCNISNMEHEKSFLSYMFTSSTPISKNCLITPVKMSITLKTTGATIASQTVNNSYSLSNLKKGIISGNIEYSLTDYYGKLYTFQLNNGGRASSVSLTLIPRNQKYEFKLNNGSSQGDNGKLNFQKLYEKYQKRELVLEDFNPQKKK